MSILNTIAKILFVLALVIPHFGASAKYAHTYTNYCADASTVLCLRFNDDGNGKVIDLSGNGNIGILDGTWTSSGKEGGGIDLEDTSTQEIEIPDPGLGTGDFSYFAWVKLETNSDEMWFMAPDSSGNNELALYVGTGSNNVHCTVNNNASVATSTDSVSTGTWTHIGCTRSGSTVQTWINGQTNGSSGTESGTLNFGGCQAFIGLDIDSGSCTSTKGNYFDGVIDEFIASSRAFSASEVLDIYENGLK